MADLTQKGQSGVGSSRTRSRTEVRQQDVFEYNNFQVQPAHNFGRINDEVVVKNQNGGAINSLLQGLGLAENLLESGTKAYAIKQEGELNEGQAAYSRGDKRTGDETEMWIRGYEKMRGAGEGYLELQTLLNEHFNENIGKDPKAFAVSQDKAIAEFFTGRNDAYIEGALPGAISLQREYQREYIANQQKELELNKLTQSNNLLNANITQMYKEGTASPEALRRELTNAQLRGKALGHTKRVASGQMVKIMGDKAIKSGDKSYMEFAYIPDVDGIMAVDDPTIATMVTEIEQRADTAAARMQAAKDEKQKELTKTTTANLLGSLSELSNVAGNPKYSMEDRMEAVREIEQKIYTYSDSRRNPDGIVLSRTELDHFYGVINTLTGMNDGLFAAESDPNVEAILRNMAKTNPDALSGEVMDKFRIALSKDDWVSIFNERTTTVVNRAKEGHKPTEQEKRWIANKKLGADIVNAKDEAQVSLYNYGPKRELIYNQIVNNLQDEFIKNNNRWPTNEEQTKMIELAEMEVDKHPIYGRNEKGQIRGGLTYAGALKMMGETQNVEAGDDPDDDEALLREVQRLKQTPVVQMEMPNSP